MNIPQSALEPFGIIGMPAIHSMYDSFTPSEIFDFAKAILANIPLPILPDDIHMLEVILLKYNVEDLRIFNSGEHYALKFRVPNQPGYCVGAIGCI